MAVLFKGSSSNKFVPFKGSSSTYWILKNLIFGLYPSSNVFSLKTTFRELVLLPYSSKKGEEGVAPPPPFYLKTEAEPASETLFLKKCITPSSEPFRIDLLRSGLPFALDLFLCRKKKKHVEFGALQYLCICSKTHKRQIYVVPAGVRAEGSLPVYSTTKTLFSLDTL
jgi:hypothetical protein